MKQVNCPECDKQISWISLLFRSPLSLSCPYCQSYLRIIPSKITNFILSALVLCSALTGLLAAAINSGDISPAQFSFALAMLLIITASLVGYLLVLIAKPGRLKIQSIKQVTHFYSKLSLYILLLCIALLFTFQIASYLNFSNKLSTVDIEPIPVENWVPQPEAEGSIVLTCHSPTEFSTNLGDCSYEKTEGDVSVALCNKEASPVSGIVYSWIPYCLFARSKFGENLSPDCTAAVKAILATQKSSISPFNIFDNQTIFYRVLLAWRLGSMKMKEPNLFYDRGNRLDIVSPEGMHTITNNGWMFTFASRTNSITTMKELSNKIKLKCPQADITSAEENAIIEGINRGIFNQ